MKKIFLILAILFGTLSITAQTRDQTLIALQNLQFDYEKEKAKVGSLESQLSLKDLLITTLQSHISTLEKIVSNVDKQTANNDKADKLTQDIILNLRSEILAYKQEVESLRKRVDKERRIGDYKLGAGLFGGYIIGNKAN